jgi:UDP-N-acetylglucosamine 2-epimerase (non-hydrolysing)
MESRLHCVLGTRAQIIKMAPVIRQWEISGRPINIVMTGQHRNTVDTLFADFGICTQPRYVYDGPEISGIASMALWLPIIVWRMVRNAEAYFPSRQGIIVVHGDTVSTLAGALTGKLLRMKVAHVEAGLRSYNIFHPFPEELTRLAVFRLSDIAFCPGTWAVQNMRRYRCERIDTGMNTIVDAVRLVMNDAGTLHSAEGYGYGVISIHRFENIFFTRRLQRIVEMLEFAACNSRLVFVLHPATEKRLRHTGLYERLTANANIELRPRMGYTEFIRLIMAARFVVTDGGSNQEELSLTDIPVYLMRKATERLDGLGKNILLGNYDVEAFRNFLSHALARPVIRAANQLPTDSPAQLICNHLLPITFHGSANAR